MGNRLTCLFTVLGFLSSLLWLCSTLAMLWLCHRGRIWNCILNMKAAMYRKEARRVSTKAWRVWFILFFKQNCPWLKAFFKKERGFWSLLRARKRPGPGAQSKPPAAGPMFQTWSALFFIMFWGIKMPIVLKAFTLAAEKGAGLWQGPALSTLQPWQALPFSNCSTSCPFLSPVAVI